MRKLLFLLSLASLALTPPLTPGQARLTGRISGRVSDKDGQPVAGATVSARSPALQGERRAATKENGEFLLGLLPVGRYRIIISAPGYGELDFPLVLSLGQTVPVNVTLQAAQRRTEEVTVVGEPSILETTTGGENFAMDALVENLPIQDRSIESVAENAPNIAPGPNTAPRIAGANAFDTIVLLDGAEISDPYFGSAARLYIEDALQEIQVLTTGISARYGRFQGGVINAVTKSGGNDFNGSMRVDLSNQRWNNPTPWGEDRADDVSWSSMYTLGGYVLRDRLWFFLAGWYEPETETAETPLSAGSIISRRREKRWQYKLRGAITPDHVVELSYLDQETKIGGYVGLPAGEPRAQGLRRDPRSTLTFNYQGIASPTLFIDFQATKKNVEIRGGGLAAKGSPFLEQNEFAVYHNHWWDYDDPESRDNETLSLNLTYAPRRQAWGRHTIEGGVQWISSETGGDNRQSPTGFNLLADARDADFVIRYQGKDSAAAYFDPGRAGQPVIHPDGQVHYNLYPDQGQFQRWQALELGARATLDYTAAYLQDSWQIDRLRLDLGLRYESYDGNGPLGFQTVDFADLSPRVGVTYSLSPGWQVQASWGKYLARFNDAYSNQASGVASAPRVERTDYIGAPLLDVDGSVIDQALQDESNWGPITTYLSPEFRTSVTAPGVESAYASDFNFSVKTALSRGRGSFEARFTHRRFERLVDDFRGGAYEKVIAIDPEGDGTILAEVDQTVWDNASDARREYDALTLVCDYRPGEKWNIGGNYTWSITKGNYTGEDVNQPASGSQVGDYPLSVPASAVAPGRLPGDLTHRLRFWGIYRMDFANRGLLSLGGLFRFSSGDVWARAADVRIWVDDPAAVNDTDTFYTHYFEKRGAHRFPSHWAIDASARYEFGLLRDLHGWVKINVLNILDRDQMIRFNTSGSAVTAPGQLRDPDGQLVLDEFGQPISVEIPVAFEAGPKFGRAEGPQSFQTPRTYLLTLGLRWR